jgi:DNA topoisomerase VI subunit B
MKTRKNVRTRNSAKSKKQALSFGPKLARTTFQTSREMDFFSEKELVTQTGHDRSEWPLVIVKELTDNGLDGCEDADIAPVIKVTADARGITVADNGPGLPELTLKGAMDFSVRTSDKEAYVSPCRGAQGNALKTLIPMPVVIDADYGKLIVEAHGKRHIIRCRVDPISQRVAVQDDVTKMQTRGTTVRLEWSERRYNGMVIWPFDTGEPRSLADQIRQLVEGFALFNPHATITLKWFEHTTTWKATNTRWQKWKPDRPTSAHWYEPPHLERLIGAYVTHDREAGTDRLVSDFIAEFDGLSGSQKRTKVLDDSNLKRMKLSELVAGDQFDHQRIAKLLAAMQTHTRPIKSATLGIIGEKHLRARLLAMGVKPESFRYGRKLSKPECKNRATRDVEKASFLPTVLESAFGLLSDEWQGRRILSGANWSAALKNPFRSFGHTGEGLETALADVRATRHEPVVFVLHLAHPRVEYTDRGKSALLIKEGTA